MICPRTTLACPRWPCPGATDHDICRFSQVLDNLRHPRPLPPIERLVSPTGRPRVGFLAPCLLQGGAEAHQVALINATRDRWDWQGVAVNLSSSQCNPTMVGLTRSSLPVEFGGRAMRDLAGRCDVLISWVAGDLERVITGIHPRSKLIHVEHFLHSEIYDPATRWALRLVDHLVGVSELCCPAFPPEFAGRTSIIPNAVDENRLQLTEPRSVVRSRWGIPDDAPVAGYYGRIAPVKRPDLMLRLAESLPSGWHVVVIGDVGPAGEYAAQLHADWLRLLASIRDRVHILPADPHSGNVLSGFDVLVVPSDSESFGLVVAEGLWSGIPVVATRTGLAQLHPELVYPIPVDATGPTLASQVIRAQRFGPRPGSQRFARDQFSPARSTRLWFDLIDQVLRADDREIAQGDDFPISPISMIY